MRPRRLLRFSCLTFLLAAAGFADVPLVRDGEPAADIVIAEDAPRGVELAAEDLQLHLRLMSGAELPIVRMPSPDFKSHVFVGRSEFTDKLGFKPATFDNSGLEIVVEDDHVILDGPLKHWEPSPYQSLWTDSKYLRGSAITGKVFPKPKNFPSPGLKAWQDFCGETFSLDHLNNGPGPLNKPLGIRTNDDIGPWHAVAELLERLGVRWYMPYENGTVVPEMKTIVVPEQRVRKEAAFAKREWCFYNAMRGDAEGIRWLKRLKAGDHRIILYNHTTYAIYSSYEQQLAHPEYLAKDAKGEYYVGYPTGRGSPRYTNPGFRQAAATYMDKVFESQPDLSAMTVGPPDGGVNVDPRDLPKYGKPSDSREQKASNYVWDFHAFLADKLKKSHPDKILLYMTGARARELPTNIDVFPDNLVVPFGDASAYRVEKSRDEQVLAARRQWLDAMRKANVKPLAKSPVWDYFLWYRTPSHPRYPVVFTRSLQAQTREMLPYADGKFIEIQPEKYHVEGEKYPRWRLGEAGLIHLMVYWQNKLFWDPDADRETFLNEYYRLFFGPAEAEMREFYEFAEEVWTRQEPRGISATTGFIKEDDVDRFFAILAKARKKAGADTVFDKRIAMIEEEMSPLKSLFANLKRSGPWRRAFFTPEGVKIDGDLSEFKNGWSTLVDSTTGDRPAKNATHAVVCLDRGKSALTIGVACDENRMNELKADCAANDDASIFKDDVVEIYVNTPQHSFFKIAVNPNNAVWTESTDVAIVERDTLPILWNPKITSTVRKESNQWIVEVSIPTDDFGDMGPTKTIPWGIQIGRRRRTGGDDETWTLAPTCGKPFDATGTWGNLWMR